MKPKPNIINLTEQHSPQSPPHAPHPKPQDLNKLRQQQFINKYVYDLTQPSLLSDKIQQYSNFKHARMNVDDRVASQSDGDCKIVVKDPLEIYEICEKGVNGRGRIRGNVYQECGKSVPYAQMTKNGVQNKSLMVGEKKLMRCKICQKKVSAQDSQIFCPKCLKKCHTLCLSDPNQCPRCKYNLVTKTHNRPNSRLSYKALPYTTFHSNTPTSMKLPSAYPYPPSKQSTYSSLNKKKQFIPSYCPGLYPRKKSLPLSNLPQQYKKQAQQFVGKYGMYYCDGCIVFPVDEGLIDKYEFLRVFLRQDIKKLPQEEGLPQYFQELLYVWNFYASFDCILQPNKFSTIPLQSFQKSLSTTPLSHFLLPLLQTLLSYNPSSPNPTPHKSTLYKLYQDFKNVNLLQYICQYFWHTILLELLKNISYKSKDKDNEEIESRVEELEEKLRVWGEKRVIDVEDMGEKLGVIGVVVRVVERMGCFRAMIADQDKQAYQNYTTLLTHLKSQKQSSQQTQQQTSTSLRTLLPTLLTLRTSTSTSQTNYTQQTQQSHNKLQQLQQQKQKLLKKQQKYRKQLRQYRNDIKGVEYLYQIFACSKVVMLGRDAKGRRYWFVGRTEVRDVVFVEGCKEGGSNWGFYHTYLIGELLQSLNVCGISQLNLKTNIQLLLQLHLIRISSSQQSSKSQYYLDSTITPSPTSPTSPSSPSSPSQSPDPITLFLHQAISQINLSQLRKLLIQTHSLFNNLVRKEVGIWRVNDFYQQKTRHEKFKNLGDIKNFLSQFAAALYSMSDGISGRDKKRGKTKRASQIWKNRSNEYHAWKRAVTNSNKNNQVFMLALMLYLQVARATDTQRMQFIPKKKIYTKCKKQKWSGSNSSKSSSKSASPDNSKSNSGDDSRDGEFQEEKQIGNLRKVKNQMHV